MSDKVKVVIKHTGEIMEFAWKSEAEMAEAYESITQTIKALERAKEKLKDKVIASMPSDEYHVSPTYVWKLRPRTYTNYDPFTLRSALGEDVFLDLIKADKKKVQEYLEEAVRNNELDKEVSVQLKETMIEEREPTVALVLEKIE